MKELFIKQTFIFATLIFGVCSIMASDVLKKDPNMHYDNKIELIEVAEHQVFCEEIVPRKCLYVKREGAKKFTPLWDQIENFKYIPGFAYKLKVEIETNPRPAKDTSGYKYFLKEIVSRDAVSIDANTNLYLSKWYLTHIKGEKISGGKPFIVFRKEKGDFYGSTGCNSMGGQFELDMLQVSFSRIRQTKRACANMQTVESPFTTILGGKNDLEVEYDRLYFKRNGVIILEFKSNWVE